MGVFFVRMRGFKTQKGLLALEYYTHTNIMRNSCCMKRGRGKRGSCCVKRGCRKRGPCCVKRGRDKRGPCCVKSGRGKWAWKEGLMLRERGLSVATEEVEKKVHAA